MPELEHVIELLESEDLYLPAGELGYIGHWVTAPGRSRRFDTRFFVAAAPPGQEGLHDAAETVHTLWLSPREALERAARGEIELVYATRHTLGELKPFSTVEAAMRHVPLSRTITTVCRFDCSPAIGPVGIFKTDAE